MVINIKDKELIIFDLDDTLYLTRASIEIQNKYHKEIGKFLETLYNLGKKLVLVTHNAYPENILVNLGIRHLFTIISKPELIDYDRLHLIEKKPTVSNLVICDRIVRLIENKDIMIARILEELKIDKTKAIFFDDYFYNIEDVRKFGIESIHVSYARGIDIDNVIIL
jgi:HAD superfamily phosphatase (TIGR01681 family)